MSRPPERPASHLLPLSAALFTAGVAGFYWYVISAQGDANDQRPRHVLISLILAATAFVASELSRRLWLRLVLLVFGTSTIVIFALVAAMSIGLFLFPAIVLAARAVGEARRRSPSPTAWKAVSAGVLPSVALAVFVFGLS